MKSTISNASPQQNAFSFLLFVCSAKQKIADDCEFQVEMPQFQTWTQRGQSFFEERTEFFAEFFHRKMVYRMKVNYFRAQFAHYITWKQLSGI